MVLKLSRPSFTQLLPPTVSSLKSLSSIKKKIYETWRKSGKEVHQIILWVLHNCIAVVLKSKVRLYEMQAFQLKSFCRGPSSCHTLHFLQGIQYNCLMHNLTWKIFSKNKLAPCHNGWYWEFRYRWYMDWSRCIMGLP